MYAFPLQSVFVSLILSDPARDWSALEEGQEKLPSPTRSGKFLSSVRCNQIMSFGSGGQYSILHLTQQSYPSIVHRILGFSNALLTSSFNILMTFSLINELNKIFYVYSFHICRDS